MVRTRMVLAITLLLISLFTPEEQSYGTGARVASDSCSDARYLYLSVKFCEFTFNKLRYRLRVFLAG